MTVTVQKSEAKLDELLAWAQQGFEVVIMQGETTLAKVVPSETHPVQPKERILGAHPGAWMSDDFDAPLPDEFWFGKDT